MMKRQGDLLIIEVAEIPRDAFKKDSLVLAEGERTGHRHTLSGGRVYEKDGHSYFEVQETPVELTHPEHHPLTFPPGRYEVIRQREYEPEGWRHVED